MEKEIIKVGDRVKVQYWYIEFESKVTHKDTDGYLHIDPDNYLYDKYGYAYKRNADGRLFRQTNKGISKL